MSTVDKFLPEVRPYAPGVPDAVAYKAIRNAAIEFCERTRLWRFEDEYTVTAEDCEAIYTPAQAILHDIEMVLFNGQELKPMATRDLDRELKGWRTNEQATALPAYYTQIDNATLRIVPPADGTVFIAFRLKPSATTLEIPDFIADEYREVIGWGALGRILTTPGQSYSNPDLGMFYANKFTEKLDRLSTKGTTGQQNAPKRTRSTYF